jgi:hypothetical protein
VRGRNCKWQRNERHEWGGTRSIDVIASGVLRKKIARRRSGVSKLFRATTRSSVRTWAENRVLPQTYDLGLGFSGFVRSLRFVVLQDVPGGNKRFFEVAINLAQFPEDQNKENRDHEQQELDIHLLAL